MRAESPLAEKIRQVIEPSVHDLGFRTVLIRIEGAGKRQSRVQVLAEPLEDRPITMDECAVISRTVSTLLDVQDPINGSYTLEVSSPGIDRPLMNEQDFERFKGFDTKIEMDEAIDGRKRFKGKIENVENGIVRIKASEGDEVFNLNLAGMSSAKLVLTDELINFMQKKYGKKTD